MRFEKKFLTNQDTYVIINKLSYETAQTTKTAKYFEKT